MTAWTSNDKLLAELSTSDTTGRNSHLIYTVIWLFFDVKKSSLLAETTNN